MITTHETDIDDKARHEIEKHRSVISDTRLHRIVSRFVVFGTGVFGGYFLGFIVYQSIWGPPVPINWIVSLMDKHWPALVGTPMSAISAFCIVSLLRVTNGPIEFEGLGFKFRGASGPVVLWVVCFLALAAALSLLWKSAA